MEDIGEIVLAHIIYLLLLFFINRSVIKRKKRDFLYWFVLAMDSLYILVVLLLTYILIDLGTHPDPGEGFAWGMMSLIIPGLLILTICIVFSVVRAFKNNSTK